MGALLTAMFSILAGAAQTVKKPTKKQVQEQDQLIHIRCLFQLHFFWVAAL